ncbi:hypothetical protein CCP4SC76_7160003 [Gammaproteobacteria bacterium]
MGTVMTYPRISQDHLDSLVPDTNQAGGGLNGYNQYVAKLCHIKITGLKVNWALAIEK